MNHLWVNRLQNFDRLILQNQTAVVVHTRWYVDLQEILHVMEEVLVEDAEEKVPVKNITCSCLASATGRAEANFQLEELTPQELLNKVSFPHFFLCLPAHSCSQLTVTGEFPKALRC